MKIKLISSTLALAALLFAAGTLNAQRFSVGVGIGYAPRPVYGYVAPPPIYRSAYVGVAPGPNYAYVDPYYYPTVGGRYAYRAGYWAPRPFVGAAWVGPRYYGRTYYHGYWRR